MKIINLSEAEKAELKRLHKSIKDGKSRDKLKAILMLDAGYTSVEIAAVLILDENTITEWKKRHTFPFENLITWVDVVSLASIGRSMVHTLLGGGL